MTEESIETLGDALPKEMARVRDQVLPQYIAIGAPGSIAAHLMRASLDKAAHAMASGDLVEMINAYYDLKGYST